MPELKLGPTDTLEPELKLGPTDTLGPTGVYPSHRSIGFFTLGWKGSGIFAPERADAYAA